MLTFATLDGRPPEAYGIQITVEDRGRGVDVFAYNYQIDGDRTQDSTIHLSNSLHTTRDLSNSLKLIVAKTVFSHHRLHTRRPTLR